MVDGNIPPLNAADDKKSRMFLWNNIFFSLGFDMKDHYGAFGGDAAAYAAIVSFNGNFYTLVTTIVQYRTVYFLFIVQALGK